MLIALAQVAAILLLNFKGHCQATDLHVASRPVMLSEPVVEVLETGKRRDYGGLRTTRAVWRKISPLPEAYAFGGPLLLVAVPAIFVAEVVTGVLTVPIDLVAGPFRKVTTATWRVSGRITDSLGHPLGDVSVKVVIFSDVWRGGFLVSRRPRLASAISATNPQGEFSVTLSGRVIAGNRVHLNISSLAEDGIPLSVKEGQYPAPR